MNKGLTLGAFLFLSVSAFLPVYASARINTEDHRAGLLSMHARVKYVPAGKKESRSLQREENKLVRAERRMARLQKFFESRQGQKRIGGFSDPVDRWFWLWLLTWGAGLLLTLIAGGAVTTGGLGLLWFMLFVAGSISLVVWLVNRFR